MASFKILSWVSLTGLLLACPLFGQVAKPQLLTANEYGLWSTLQLGETSGDGKFVSYSLNYTSGNDTLFVINVKGTKVFEIPKGYRGAFHGDYFVSLKPERELVVCDLATGSIRVLQDVDDFDLLEDGKLLLAKDGRITLEIVEMGGKMLRRLTDVTSFAVNPDKRSMGVVLDQNGFQKLQLVSSSGTVSEIMATNTGHYANIRWDDTGQFLTFSEGARLVDASVLTMYLYDMRSKKAKSVKLPKEHGQLFDVGVSADGQRVAVYSISPQRDSLARPLPEVWNAKDPVPYSSQGRYSKMKAYLWHLNNNEFSEITSSEFTRAMVSTDLRFAVLENPLANMPSFKPEPDRDLFIKDLEKGTVIPFLSKFSGQAERLVMSPNGAAVLYFDKGNWMQYEFKTQKTKLLTDGLGVDFGDEDNDRPEENRPHALPIWSADGSIIYLYDKFDIWSVNRSETKRLTHGREKLLVYRFAKTASYNPDALISKGVSLTSSDSQLLTIVATDHSISGFASLKENKVSTMREEEKRTSHIMASNGRLFWTEEDFNASPKIVMYDQNRKKKTVLFSSNPQQGKFAWGKSQLLSYRTKSGRMVNGTLFYPADYDPNKTYPMVVHIYERQTHALHTYKNPSLYEGDGFNRTNLTLQGYFVLYPDIWHEVGSPGASALDCTESAVKHVLSLVPVDRARIGLIGHSMGGYLVNYIVTHSDMFKAAVSGASTADTVSWYFSMGFNTGIPDASRYEYEQMRIGKCFFEDAESYRRISPIEKATQMNSALLLWTGGDDTQVKPWQSMEFHMALRRLGKENTLLVYPGEDHSLDSKENQMDLTLRIENWFRKYLKP